MKCGGRCQLMKQMAAQEDEKSPGSHLLKVPEFFCVLFNEKRSEPIQTALHHAASPCFFHAQENVSVIFRPPGA